MGVDERNDMPEPQEPLGSVEPGSGPGRPEETTAGAGAYPQPGAYAQPGDGWDEQPPEKPDRGLLALGAGALAVALVALALSLFSLLRDEPAAEAESVGSEEIADESITSDKIAEEAVVEASLAEGSVTEAKLADGAVTEPKLADMAVATAKLADEAVTNAKIARLAVGTGRLADDAVTGAKVTDDSLTGDDIDESTLETVPTATRADTAATAEVARERRGARHRVADADDRRRPGGERLEPGGHEVRERELPRRDQPPGRRRGHRRRCGRYRTRPELRRRKHVGRDGTGACPERGRLERRRGRVLRGAGELTDRPLQGRNTRRAHASWEVQNPQRRAANGISLAHSGQTFSVASSPLWRRACNAL